MRIAFHAVYVSHDVDPRRHLPLIRVALSNIHTANSSISTLLQYLIGWTTHTVLKRYALPCWPWNAYQRGKAVNTDSQMQIRPTLETMDSIVAKWALQPASTVPAGQFKASRSHQARPLTLASINPCSVEKFEVRHSHHVFGLLEDR